MVELASDKAILLNMHRGLEKLCDQWDDSELEEDEKQRRREEAKAKDPQSTEIDGAFYDVRIKSHSNDQGKQVIFIFTDVSDGKELQRQQVMGKYTQIMYASISHELRTPINAITNSL